MPDDVRRLHTALARMDRGRGKRFAPELRAQIIAVGSRLRAEGRSWSATAVALGLPTETVRRLCSAGEPQSRFVPVVVEPAHSGDLVLVSPSGWRVEGLATAALLALVPRLP